MSKIFHCTCLIGFCGGEFGSNGVGKTTASNFLSNKFKFYLCNLSSGVEMFAKKIENWNGEKNKEGLILLNGICTYARRINENYWLNCSIASIPKKEDKIVFDNVYFKNECDFIKNNGGFVIKIERKGYKQPDFDFNVDFVVQNDDDINVFENKIGHLLKKMYNNISFA